MNKQSMFAAGLITIAAALPVSLPAVAAGLAGQEPANMDAIKFAAEVKSSPEQELMSKLQSFTSMEGRFEQTLTSKAGKLVQTTHGSFSLKRPGLYRWLSDEPFPQEVVGNGETIWVYDPDLEQVTVTPQSQMGFNPATILSGDLAALQGKYKVSQAADGTSERYTLLPNSEQGAMFKQLTISFIEGVVSDVAFVDQLGQLSAIKFSKLTTNVALADDLFEFVAPEGADVLMNE